MTAEATFAGTLPAIQRTQDHRYGYNGQWYPGVTEILKVIDKSGALMTWAARQTAEAALSLYDYEGMDREDAAGADGLGALMAVVGREGTVKALTARANWTRDEAASLGSAVHNLADELVSGRPLSVESPLAHEYAKGYADWWAASGWRLRLSEAVVVHPDVGYGGTFDLLAYDRDGRTVLADIKTGKAVYKEAILQLCAYGMAPLVSPMGGDRVYPMPIPDRYAVIHVTKDGVREVCIDVGQAERMAFLDCVDLHRWLASVKGKTL
jgi:hypothetical protein